MSTAMLNLKLVGERPAHDRRRLSPASAPPSATGRVVVAASTHPGEEIAIVRAPSRQTGRPAAA